MSDDKKYDDTRTSSGERLPYRCEVCYHCTLLNHVKRQMMAVINDCISRRVAVDDTTLNIWNEAVALYQCEDMQEDENIHVGSIADIDHKCPVCHGSLCLKEDKQHHSEWWECVICRRVVIEHGEPCDG